MPKGFIFWLLMILWLLSLLGAIWYSNSYLTIGGSVMLWIIIALIGWQVFGNMIK